jgi:hypothetical protein
MTPFRGGKAVRPRQQLVLGPEEIKLLRAAFDATWEIVKAHSSDSPQSIDVARLRVANAVLAAWRDGADDLKAASLEMMQRWG